MTTTYEIFGLSEEKVIELTERFGEAVQASDPDEGNMIVDLEDIDAHNMIADGFSMAPASKPKPQ